MVQASLSERSRHALLPLPDRVRTWLSYNDPSWFAKRHGLDREVEATINAMTGALEAIARAAAAP